ncbi:hypothetical protein MW329_001892 [Vibrio vulnificus]|nr:hypothetical protein [Vibrio vulnificus]
MHFRIFCTILPLALIIGCQSAPQKQSIPDNVLEYLSTQWVIIESCYNSGDYDVQQSVNYRDAINYSFSTWAVSQADIDRVVGEKRQMIADFKATHYGLGTTCKDWHLNLETAVRNASNHKHQANLNQQRNHEMNKARASSSSNYFSGSNNMIQCTSLGDLSFSKNIQTFKGSVCPIGWLPYTGW